ncbi:uncharacterized protein MONBRDRAFT_21832 [Monosiga brevicollis MX1]|uniref:Amine oxidase domain-containing protein n=1 Tax=Monosiga brevicollis TaxID=81824 RepID=A9UNR2_MONBE|nr:uncharacterized protein MONBRDRAFT_21832 [Monosiga brevicollis MX1]EDQ92744.1 predicted protein [Monosiga brevicollis MX1]|eukprot:XP_001742506.1 hypothetical protein [Monosiga brevicollis MX1]
MLLDLLLALPLWQLVALVTVVVVGSVRWFLHQQHHGCIPRGYSSAKFIRPEQMPEHKEGHRDEYKGSKVPKDIDVILVGSGIGSLSCAAMLSRAGKRCLVLEQHHIAGGATHAFTSKGFEFDTGIHYIGNIHKRQKYFDLMTETPLEWDRMGRLPWDIEEAYDELRIGDKSYFLSAGIDNYVEALAKHFPEERDTIRRWAECCIEASNKSLFFGLKIARPRWLARLLNRLTGQTFFKNTQRTAMEVAKEFTSNPELLAAMTAQFGDYGRSPTEESFFLHASVANHYMNGGWYPRGGSTVIAKGIGRVIERTGGRVLVRAPVEEILIEDGKAAGVRLENGDIIKAGTVVAGCGVLNTYTKLLPPEHVPKSITDKITELGVSCSMVYVFVGMKGTPDELKLRTSNIWHWPEKDYDEMLQKWFDDPETAEPPVFLGFPSAKDSTWNERFPNQANAVLLTMCPYEWWESWEGTIHKRRPDDYNAKKEMIQDKVLEVLFKYYPQCRDNITLLRVSTSLTFNHYLRSQRGEVYGLESSPMRFQEDDWLRPDTHIPGLYLTGQDVLTLGVTGALMAGVLTAHSVLGYGSIVDVASGRNLVEDIWHLDASKKDAQLKKID